MTETKQNGKAPAKLTPEQEKIYKGWAELLDGPEEETNKGGENSNNEDK